MPYDVAEKLKCVERELALRKRVYPRLIASGRLNEARAKREIELMQEIVVDYQRSATLLHGKNPFGIPNDVPPV